mmetsp:Transcript_42415/g.77006  ORF Transcript_42415/g.77006 Transcript_42415/m.77006 type:complete len:135 (-) Transcript_42415:147-551(-)
MESTADTDKAKATEDVVGAEAVVGTQEQCTEEGRRHSKEVRDVDRKDKNEQKDKQTDSDLFAAMAAKAEAELAALAAKDESSADEELEVSFRHPDATMSFNHKELRKERNLQKREDRKVDRLSNTFSKKRSGEV